MESIANTIPYNGIHVIKPTRFWIGKIPKKIDIYIYIYDTNIKVLNDHLVGYPKKRGKNGIFYLYILHLKNSTKALVSVVKPWPLQSERIWNARHPEMGLVIFVGREKNVVCFGGLGWCWVIFFWWFGLLMWYEWWEERIAERFVEGDAIIGGKFKAGKTFPFAGSKKVYSNVVVQGGRDDHVWCASTWYRKILDVFDSVGTNQAQDDMWV